MSRLWRSPWHTHCSEARSAYMDMGWQRNFPYDESLSALFYQYR